MFATDALRFRLTETMAGHRCPSCGHRHGAISGRVVALGTGLEQSTVSRFVAGRVSAGTTTDALTAWLDARA